MDSWNVTVEPFASTCRDGTTASAGMVTMTTECSQPMESHVKVSSVMSVCNIRLKFRKVWVT